MACSNGVCGIQQKPLNTGEKMPGFWDNVGNFFVGKEGQTKQIPRYTDQQTSLMNQLSNLGMQGINASKPSLLRQLQPQNRIPNPLLNQLLQQTLAGSKGSPNLSFDPIENRARQQFQTQGVPGLAERFTSLGGGQRSSAFQGALGSAQSDLESQLAALRSQYGLQQAQQQSKDQLLRQNLLGSLFGIQSGQQGQQFGQLGSLLNYGLQSRFDPLYIPQSPGFLQSFGSAAAQGLGQALPFFFL